MDSDSDKSASGAFSEANATFGDRLAHAREARGLSEAELAGKLGLSTDVIRDWERDRAEPPGNRLQLLAGLLDVAITWLLTGEGDGPGPVSSEGLAAELRAIADLQDRLAERVRGLEARIARITSEEGADA